MTMVFPSEFCETFKSTYFLEHLLTVACLVAEFERAAFERAEFERAVILTHPVPLSVLLSN